MLQTIKAVLICLKLKCHVSCSLSILNALFLPKCFTNFDFNWPTSFKNLSLTDIMQRVFLHYYSVSIKLM